MIKFAVLSFPGTNCETETVRAFKRAGMDAEMVLWNDERLKNGAGLSEFSGYCIAGGFSYEDRGRSGVVSAQDSVMEVVRQEAAKGKVVLGICNGAQILVETGLVPGYSNHALGMALAWNEMRQGGEVVDTGFYNAWCYLKNEAPKNRSPFNDFDEVLHIPFAHGEGRFVMSDALFNQLEGNGQIVFKYCNEDGDISQEYPTTPNGAKGAIAAICNPTGNVMAIMPHPERDPERNGYTIFSSIRRWIEEGKSSTEFSELGEGETPTDVRSVESFDVEVYVRLIITDNTERTLEEVIQCKGMDAKLKRFEFFGLNLKPDQKATPELIESLMKSGELANLNKHQVYIKTAEGMFSYEKDRGLVSSDLNLDSYVIAVDYQDTVGEHKADALHLHMGDAVESVRFGVLWQFVETGEDVRQQVMDSFILYNPFSMFLMA